MNLANHDIEQLLRLCLAENRQAQMEIYNRYYKAMYNTSLRIVQNRFEAEDIMQESFLTAFTKLKTIKDLKTFGAWLKKIVVNNSIQHYNKIKAKSTTPIEDQLYKIKVENECEQDDSYISKRASAVLASLNNLKDNYRMGLTLHLIEGYDYEEIGDIMGISYGNCRTMISRAKESLRQNLIPIN